MKNDLNFLYEGWVRLTQKEAEAIQSANWRLAQEFQKEKEGMKPLIDAAHSEFDSKISTAPIKSESPFRKNVGHLISLENRNSELLNAQFARLKRERMELEEASKNSQKIRTSYLQASPEIDWQCLS